MSEAMDHFKRISRVNLGILVVYSTLPNIYFGMAFPRGDGSWMILWGLVVCVHVILLFFCSCFYFSKNERRFGLNYLLMIGLVFLVGFSFCVGGTYL